MIGARIFDFDLWLVVGTP